MGNTFEKLSSFSNENRRNCLRCFLSYHGMIRFRKFLSKNHQRIKNNIIYALKNEHILVIFGQCCNGQSVQKDFLDDFAHVEKRIFLWYDTCNEKSIRERYIFYEVKV